jgi:hypothetical protein
MPVHVIASDTFVVTARGTLLSGELEPGIDQVLMVQGGALKFAHLKEAAQDGEPRNAWRLLTPVGDILLAEGSFLMTRDGPLAGQDIALRIAKERQTRMEVVGPADLPDMAADATPLREIYQACVVSLSEQVIQIPRNGVDALVEDRIVECLGEAGIESKRFRDERWLAFHVDVPAERENGSIGPCHRKHAEALLSLTAWQSDGEQTASRVRFEDSTLRRRLLASLAGSRCGFEVKWVPAYRPIECRIYRREARSMRPFVPVQAALAERARVHRLELEDPGHLVVGLAVIATHAA